jgi:hypothetical protein
VIECAWRHGVPVRCVWATTNIADAQINAITRLIETHGSLPSPEVIRERGREDPRYLGPDAQFRYERTVEPPVADEGFTSIEQRVFARRALPNADCRALILDADDVNQVHREALSRYQADGWLLFAHAWRPQIARRTLTREAVDEALAATRQALGLDITFAVCPHDAGPPICWCRKPLPGSILEFATRKAVALERSLLIARSAADRTMAERLGIPFSDVIPIEAA